MSSLSHIDRQGFQTRFDAPNLAKNRAKYRPLPGVDPKKRYLTLFKSEVILPNSLSAIGISKELTKAKEEGRMNLGFLLVESNEA
jgi:hypothetical protein